MTTPKITQEELRTLKKAYKSHDDMLKVISEVERLREENYHIKVYNKLFVGAWPKDVLMPMYSRDGSFSIETFTGDVPELIQKHGGKTQ